MSWKLFQLLWWKGVVRPCMGKLLVYFRQMNNCTKDNSFPFFPSGAALSGGHCQSSVSTWFIASPSVSPSNFTFVFHHIYQPPLCYSSMHPGSLRMHHDVCDDCITDIHQQTISLWPQRLVLAVIPDPVHSWPLPKWGQLFPAFFPSSPILSQN